MRAMLLERVGERLVERDLRDPTPGAGEVLVRVRACGVCRTDLHVVDGELERPKLPLVPGHQIVGEVVAGGDAAGVALGARVGIPWLAWTCGTCRYCRAGDENLCDAARFTGYDVDGGYAELCVADARACLALPDGPPDAELAPLLCAGLIGYRSLRMAGDPATLGLVGFGAAAHLVCQVAVHEGRRVLAVTRPGDDDAQALARSLGAAWAGPLDELPEELDAAIVFAPAGELVPACLRAVRKGGAVVCAGIHMSDIPSFPYASLWGERSIRSVANLTHRDGVEFLALAAAAGVRATVETFPLEAANEALDRLRAGRVTGSAVLVL